MKPRIEWDEAKNALNKRKHGVCFEEASTVFADEHALLLADPDHSTEEDRFILMGFSASLRILVVWSVTVIGMGRKSYESSRHAKRRNLSVPNIAKGGENEERV